jgi:hypothetical protein
MAAIQPTRPDAGPPPTGPRGKWLVLLTAAACLTVGLAPLASARWQTLDDGLTAGGLLTQFDSDLNKFLRGMGRNFYFPGLYFDGLRSVFGTEVRGFYLAQAGFFLGSCLLLFAITRRGTGSAALACLSALLFAASSTVPEVIYTLYKFEVRVLFFSLLSLYCLLRCAAPAPEGRDRQRAGAERPQGGAPARRAAWLVASLLAVVPGYFVGKETVAILAPAALASAAVLLVLGRGPSRRASVVLAAYGAGVAATVFGCIKLNHLLGVAPPGQGSYTGTLLGLLPPDELLIRWQTMRALLADVLVLVALAAALGLAALPAVRARGDAPWAVMGPLATAAALGYFAFQALLWKWLQVYYYYPASALLALSIALQLAALRTVRATWLRRAGGAAVALGVGAFLYHALPQHLNRAMAHRAWSRLDDRMISWVASLPPGSEVAFNYVPGHETLSHLPHLLKFLHQRRDIRVVSALEDGYDPHVRGPNAYLACNFDGPGNLQIAGRGYLLHVDPHWVEKTKALLIKLESVPPAGHLECRRAGWSFPPAAREPVVFEYGWRFYQLGPRPAGTRASR